MSDLTPNKFALIIENMVKENRMAYMDAILEYCKIHEIGTTNKTHLKDYDDAINSNTGLIMIAHTSNYKVVVFTESVEIKELIKVANKKTFLSLLIKIK